MVGCSQCGQTFGAGDSGYSACSEHRSRQDLAAAHRASTAAQAAAKAESDAYTRGTWSLGPTKSRSAWIVSTEPVVGGVRGTDDVGYYGGHLIAETVTAANARRIVACVNACAGIPTAALELCGTCIDTPEQGEHL